MAQVASIVPGFLAGALNVVSQKRAERAATAPTPTPAATDPAAEEAKKAADAEEALSQRRRGRLGTIATSFRGVLNDTSEPLQRRTLLGE